MRSRTGNIAYARLRDKNDWVAAASGLDCLDRAAEHFRGGWRFTMLSATADADYSVGEIGGEAKSFRAIDNLCRPVAIDKRFRDDEARTKRADSSIRRVGHSGHIPFNAGRLMSRDHCQPTTITSSIAREIGNPLPDHHGFLTPILATKLAFSNPPKGGFHGLSVRTP